MTCPLCSARKGRRACPALGHDICAVCCGTKRRVEIACPEDCGWLRSAQAHPPAFLQRQHAEDQRRLRLLLDAMDQEAYLALTVCLQEVVAYRRSAVPLPHDEDLRAAALALASTLETAARGVIYEHQPETLVAGRLVAVMREGLDRLTASGVRHVEQQAPVALRRIERSVREMHREAPSDPSAFFAFLGRVLRQGEDEARAGAALADRALADLAAADDRPDPAGGRIILP